jgi:hypothetical protein
LGGGCSIGRIMTGRGIEQWLIGRVGWGWHAADRCTALPCTAPGITN